MLIVDSVPGTLLSFRTAHIRLVPGEPDSRREEANFRCFTDNSRKLPSLNLGFRSVLEKLYLLYSEITARGISARSFRTASSYLALYSQEIDASSHMK